MKRFLLFLLILCQPLGAGDNLPLTLRFAKEDNITMISLETASETVYSLRDTDSNWPKRLGELYLMHWPASRRDEPALVVQGEGVTPQTVDEAVKALKAKGLKLVRFLPRSEE